MGPDAVSPCHAAVSIITPMPFTNSSVIACSKGAKPPFSAHVVSIINRPEMYQLSTYLENEPAFV
jgi:hypothetical protein